MGCEKIVYYEGWCRRNHASTTHWTKVLLFIIVYYDVLLIMKLINTVQTECYMEELSDVSYCCKVFCLVRA